jgi:hypothetical protein
MVRSLLIVVLPSVATIPNGNDETALGSTNVTTLVCVEASVPSTVSSEGAIINGLSSLPELQQPIC